jgi:hypothetical protein
MSSAADVLLYASPGDKGVESFLEKVRAESRFESAPFPVDTGDFSGPNGFMGGVWAFGADYWSFFGDDHQALLDTVRWDNPGVVVLIVRREGHASENITEVYRPVFEEVRGGYYDSEVSAVQPAAVTKR